MASAVMEKRTFLPRLKGNEVLSRDLHSQNGQLILPRGTVVSQSHIIRMKQFGVSDLWIESSESLPLERIKPEIAEAFKKTVSTVSNMFEEAKQNHIVDVEASQQILSDFVEACRSESNFLSLVVNLQSFDEYTFQHSVGVGLLSRRIAEWMGIRDEECQDLFLAATLHDIGKCRVNDNILNKPGRLSPEEYEHVKQHARFGYEILRRSGLPEHIAAPAHNHHERIDGSGYPRKLRGDQLDLFSRIVAVADVFNAMTSRRVYHEPIPYYRVLEELQNNAFGVLDPKIVNMFVSMMTTFLVGNRIVLNDGTEGTVVLVSPDRPTRPLIQTSNNFLDLKRRPELFIKNVLSV